MTSFFGISGKWFLQAITAIGREGIVYIYVI